MVRNKHFRVGATVDWGIVRQETGGQAQWPWRVELLNGIRLRDVVCLVRGAGSRRGVVMHIQQWQPD
jgi:hypothetical protein